VAGQKTARRIDSIECDFKSHAALEPFSMAIDPTPLGYPSSLSRPPIMVFRELFRHKSIEFP